MNLLKTIIAVGFGIMMFSSQSEELTIPEGELEGFVVNSQKLANSIADEFDTISEVFDVSMESELYALEVMVFGLDRFTVSFSLRTTSGSTYTNIQCEAEAGPEGRPMNLELHDCKNDQVELKRSFIIPLAHIEGENF